MKKCNNLRGKTVILTGASRGIGAVISHLLVKEGANLIGISRNEAKLKDWRKDLAQANPQRELQVRYIAFDLSQTDALDKLLPQIKQILEAWESPNVDVLINNAGVEIYRAFSDYSLREVEAVLRINLLSVMQLTHLLLPLLSPQGHIINMSSLAGKKSHPYDSVYAASKAGLLMWSHSLRQEMREGEQAVSAICPGYVVDTGMLADMDEKAPLLAGRSRAHSVAKAVINTIRHRRAEVIVNQTPMLEATTRLMLALEQLFPVLNSLSNRLLGITASNKRKAYAASHQRLTQITTQTATPTVHQTHNCLPSAHHSVTHQAESSACSPYSSF